MSSSITTEAFKESPNSKSYGSEQIQVSFLIILLFVVYGDLDDFPVYLGS